MTELVFFLEEPSAQALLEGLLPRILSQEFSTRYVVFEGKQDLERQLVRRMRGYRNSSARFIVLRDQDAGDCRRVKEALVAKCREAGCTDALVRIACREIESWYLADLAAVDSGLGTKGLARRQNTAKYRTPDRLGSPSRILSDIAPSYQKIGGSRAIGPHLNIENTRSRSFANFVSGLRRIAGGTEKT
jgi:hypothetical protein